MDDKTKFKNAYGYGKKICVSTEDGVIDFDPDKQKEVVGAEKMSYDEYLAVQDASKGKQRSAFAALYFNFPTGFKGEIEKFSKDGTRVCFKRIFTEGMFPDGEMFDGKEDHVWMGKAGFEEFQIGDSVEFFADVYRYIKTANGKILDYGLRNPEGIKPIPAYELPTDEELMEQNIRSIICETCYLSECCNGSFCTRSKEEKDLLIAQIKEMIGGNQS